MEADMVVALVMFLVTQKVPPEQITILAAYQGQTKILRNKIKEASQESWSRSPVNLSVQTVDTFQGDENSFVIVSLVRSDVDSIGFLDSINRRCVAQSRAKCGLYFVGNVDTIVRKTKNGKTWDTAWKPLIDQMKQKGCVGSQISIQCPDHPDISWHRVSGPYELEKLCHKPEDFCNVRCGKAMTCNNVAHNCSKTCSPKHDHSACFHHVEETFEKCGHPLKRLCHENPAEVACKTKVPYVLPRCGHSGMKQCYVPFEKISCSQNCPALMDCGKHPCKEKCGAKHSHVACSEEVSFTFEGCGHSGVKTCSRSSSSLVCQNDVKIILGRCQHEAIKKCFEFESEVFCKHPCGRKNVCGIHDCQRLCSEGHSHEVCREKVNYTFPGTEDYDGLGWRCYFV